jgi:hypothetical protein
MPLDPLSIKSIECCMLYGSGLPAGSCSSRHCAVEPALGATAPYMHAAPLTSVMLLRPVPFLAALLPCLPLRSTMVLILREVSTWGVYIWEHLPVIVCQGAMIVCQEQSLAAADVVALHIVYMAGECVGCSSCSGGHKACGSTEGSEVQLVEGVGRPSSRQ